MPKLDPVPQAGRIPKGVALKRLVETLLTCGKEPADAVIALTDVYTGTNPPDFVDAADAKAKMRKWVGPNLKFHPHAAQYDFEAWLLPFWSEIQRLAKSNRKTPGSSPERVNHNNPPAHRINEVFRTEGSRTSLRQTAQRRSNSPGQGLAHRRAGVPRIESVSQYDPHALSGRSHCVIRRWFGRLRTSLIQMPPEPQFQHQECPEAERMLAFAFDVLVDQVADRLGAEQSAVRGRPGRAGRRRARPSAPRGTIG